MGRDMVSSGGGICWMLLEVGRHPFKSGSDVDIGMARYCMSPQTW